METMLGAPALFCNAGAGRGVNQTAQFFRPDAGATFGDVRSISTDTDPWSCFGGKLYELNVCFSWSYCLTPKKFVW